MSTIDPTITPPAPTPAPPAAWHTALTGDDLALAQTRGWDKADAAVAAAEAVKAYRNAEKVIGIPADQIIRKPKDLSDVENWGKINDLLGVPKEAKDYTFDGVKFADGSDLDAPFAEKLRNIVATHKLPLAAAKGVAADIVKLMDESDATETATYEQKLAAEKEALKVNWGAHDYARNMIIAQNTAAKMGVDAEALSALEKTVGYAKVLDMFRKVGISWGEDKFVTNQGPTGGALSKEQANAELVALRNDTAWLARFNAGDVQAKQQFDNLTAIAARE